MMKIEVPSGRGAALKLAVLLGLLTIASSQARATVLPYTLTGTMTGLQVTAGCNWNDPGGGCPIYSSFTQDFSLFAYLDLGPGSNDFVIGGPPRAHPQYSGTIFVDGDTLTGVDFAYDFTTCGVLETTGCYGRSGSAATFEVQSGFVPEPATWIELLLGFGLLGALFRRRRTTQSPLSHTDGAFE